MNTDRCSRVVAALLRRVIRGRFSPLASGSLRPKPTSKSFQVENKNGEILGRAPDHLSTASAQAPAFAQQTHKPAAKGGESSPEASSWALCGTAFWCLLLWMNRPF